MPSIEAPATVPLDNDGGEKDRPPVMPILHMWTAPDGSSTINLSEIAGFGMESVGGKAAPIWMRSFPGQVSGLTFTVLPVGWFGDWHESPKPQWVVTLRGRWFIETMDGSRVEMGPGDTHFGQDLNTRDAQGHRSGQVGSEPCFQMFVQFSETPATRTRDPFAK